MDALAGVCFGSVISTKTGPRVFETLVDASSQLVVRGFLGRCQAAITEAIRVWNKRTESDSNPDECHHTGIDAATGNRCDIDALKWLDLQLYQICCEPLGFVSLKGTRRDIGDHGLVRPSTRSIVSPPAKAGPQFYHKNKRFDGLTLPEPDFREVLVRVADVLKAISSDGQQGIQAGQRGGRPTRCRLARDRGSSQSGNRCRRLGLPSPGGNVQAE